MEQSAIGNSCIEIYIISADDILNLHLWSEIIIRNSEDMATVWLQSSVA